MRGRYLVFCSGVPHCISVGPEQTDARITGQDGSARLEILLVEDDLLQQVGLTTAVFFRPRQPDPSGGGELALPGAAQLEDIAIRRDALVHRIVDAQFGRQVFREPRTHALAECFLLRGVLKIHRSRPLPIPHVWNFATGRCHDKLKVRAALSQRILRRASSPIGCFIIASIPHG